MSNNDNKEAYELIEELLKSNNAYLEVLQKSAPDSDPDYFALGGFGGQEKVKPSDLIALNNEVLDSIALYLIAETCPDCGGEGDFGCPAGRGGDEFAPRSICQTCEGLGEVVQEEEEKKPDLSALIRQFLKERKEE